MADVGGGEGEGEGEAFAALASKVNYADEHADMIEAFAQRKLTREQAAQHLEDYSASESGKKGLEQKAG